jgi:DNA-binding phage protein
MGNNNNNNWELMVLILRDIAKSKSITHKDIAEHTGLHRSNVSRFFSLKYCPTLSTFFLISNALGVNIFLELPDNTIDVNKSLATLERHHSKT